MIWLFVVLSAFILATLLSHIIVSAALNDWSDFNITASRSSFPETHLQMWSCILVISALALAGFVFEELTIVVTLIFTAVGFPYVLFQWKVIARKLRLLRRR